MNRPLKFGVKLLMALATLTRLAPACGDPPTNGVAGTKAQLVIQAQGGIVRIGEPVFANLILPKNSPLRTGTLSRASCTSLQFTVEPAVGWHDPWADWYYSGIPQHATGRDGPSTCGVVGGAIGMEVPPPQISFTLNDWIEFDRPGKYKISVTYRTEFRKPQEELDDPYDDRKSTTYVTLTTESIEVEVLPEAANVASLASDARILLQSHFRDDDPAWGSSDSMGFPEWTQYSRSEAVIPLLAQFYEQRPNVARRGLITTPHRDLVVHEMEKELVDPRHSVGLDFPEVLAFSAAELQHPELFGAHTDDSWSSKWERDSLERTHLFLHLLSDYTRKLLLALPDKHDGPQRDSLSVALLILARRDLPEKAELRKLAADKAAQLLPKMKVAPNLSDEEWKIIASPALLPYLRKTELYAEHMRSLYELAPNDARRMMIHSAARDDWGVVAGWAAVIPEGGKPSAALDSDLARALRKESDDIVLESYLDRILLRLGGPDLITPARQILASESCVGDSALWAFLLKQQGPLAERRLIQRYQRDSHDPTCDADLPLQQIWLNHSARYWSPQLEAIVVSQLDKPDSLAVGAAHLLEKFGSKDSEDALWSRLAKWHHSHPLRPRAGAAWQSVQDEDDLEAALQAALLDGRSWAPEPALIDRLRHLCVYRCDDLKWERSTEQVQRLTITDENQGDIGFISVSRPVTFDEFRDWIQRFPAGTRFSVTRWPGNAPLTASQVDIKYPNVGQLMRKLNLEIVNTLPYDDYGRCKRSGPASQKSSL
jgi:hypothetical protein